MNKLLVITLLIGLLSFGAQSFRMPRQAEGEEAEGVPDEPVPEAPVAEEVAPEAHEAPEAPAHEEVAPEEPAAETAPEHHQPDAPEGHEESEGVGPLTYVTGKVRDAWDTVVDTTSGWVMKIKGMKLEEKAKNLFEETMTAASTYAGIMQDQIYHTMYNQ